MLVAGSLIVEQLYEKQGKQRAIQYASDIVRLTALREADCQSALKNIKQFAID